MWEWWDAGTGCPAVLWMPHYWKHSRLGWMGLWAIWYGESSPCPQQGGWTRWSLKITSGQGTLHFFHKKLTYFTASNVNLEVMPQFYVERGLQYSNQETV